MGKNSSINGLVGNQPCTITNPFQSVGTLPSSSQSYIVRNCDLELYKQIGIKSFISVVGDFQMGKSTLLTRLYDNPPKGWKSCFIDFQSLDTVNLTELYNGFFDEVENQLGKNLNSWPTIKNFSSSNKIIFLFDDFGKIKKSHFHHIMGSIFSLSQSSININIVSASPKPIKEIFWADNNNNKHYNNKYCKGWHLIQIEPLIDAQIDCLINLLPQIIKNICYENIQVIKTHSNYHPQKLQALLQRIINKLNDNLEDTELNIKSHIELLINQKTSYE